MPRLSKAVYLNICYFDECVGLHLGTLLHFIPAMTFAISEVYLEPHKTSKMEHFAKIVNG